jgi:hypothetical protein
MTIEEKFSTGDAPEIECDSLHRPDDQPAITAMSILEAPDGQITSDFPK